MVLQQKGKKTFQEEHTKKFLAVLLGGVYPPGMETLIKNKFVLRCFYWGSYLPSIASYIYVISYVKYLILTPPENKVLLIQVTRRAIIILYMCLQPTYHIIRLKHMEKFFEIWNYEINKDFCVDERKVILAEKMKESNRTLGRYIFSRFWIAQLYNIPLMFNRNMRSSELAGMPHDKNSPYHFYYVAFQVSLFLLIGTGLAGLEFLYCWQMTMAEAECQVLKEKLGDIMSTIQIKDENKVAVKQIYPKGSVIECEMGSKEYKDGVKRVERELARWVLAHHMAIDWINDLIEYMHFIITLKYIYLGIHCSLVVIGLNGMTSSAMINDLFLILIVTGNQIAVCFNATKQADRISDITETIFHDAYAESWYLYPIHIQKDMGFISCVTNVKPLQFFGFKGYVDNSENFSAVLQTAYQVLTFVLPMAEGEG